jgi:hypothetical protein
MFYVIFRVSHKAICEDSPMLRNGIPNHESGRYLLQTGFGVAGARLLLPPAAVVKGILVVATSDAVVSYPCDEMYTHPTKFSIPSLAKPSRGSSTVDVIPIPTDPLVRICVTCNPFCSCSLICRRAQDHKTLSETIKRHGYTDIDTSFKTKASFYVTGKSGRNAVACIITQRKGTKKYDDACAFCKKCAAKATKSTKTDTASIVLVYSLKTHCYTVHIVD